LGDKALVDDCGQVVQAENCKIAGGTFYSSGIAKLNYNVGLGVVD